MSGQLATTPALGAFSVRDVQSQTHLAISSDDGHDAEYSKHYRCRYTDCSYRQPPGNPVPYQYGRHICEHHAESSANDDRVELIKAGGETDRRDLRLITDLRDEESTERRAKRSRAADRPISDLVFVGDQGPYGDAQKRKPQYPSHPGATEHVTKEGADQAGSCMVSDGGEKDPEDDRHRPQEARGKHQGKDLGLVSDLGEADDHGGQEESFHKSAVGVGRM
jgi:hypothetical protein